jgi:hypothetical protein
MVWEDRDDPLTPANLLVQTLQAVGGPKPFPLLLRECQNRHVSSKPDFRMMAKGFQLCLDMPNVFNPNNARFSNTLDFRRLKRRNDHVFGLGSSVSLRLARSVDTWI